jgi:hypothetical protein
MRKHRVIFQDYVKSQRQMLDRLKELRDQERNFRSNTKLDYLSDTDIQSKRDHLESTLITKELSTKERKKIQDEINECSRHLVNARQQY